MLNCLVRVISVYLDEHKDELIANAIVNEDKKSKELFKPDYGAPLLLPGNDCAEAKSTMFSSPWTCDAVLWHPTFSGKNPFPQSFACDNAWFLILYLVAKPYQWLLLLLLLMLLL